MLVKIILGTVLQQNTGKRLHFVQYCINEVMKNVEYSKEGVFVQQKNSRTTYHLPKGIKQQKVKRILATPSDDVGKLAAYYGKRKWI